MLWPKNKSIKFWAKTGFKDPNLIYQKWKRPSLLEIYTRIQHRKWTIPETHSSLKRKDCLRLPRIRTFDRRNTEAKLKFMFLMIWSSDPKYNWKFNKKEFDFFHLIFLFHYFYFHLKVMNEVNLILWKFQIKLIIKIYRLFYVLSAPRFENRFNSNFLISQT